jgi:hypothetical protein
LKASVLDVMQAFLVHKTHHVFLANDQGKPVTVLTMTGTMSFVAVHQCAAYRHG